MELEELKRQRDEINEKIHEIEHAEKQKKLLNLKKKYLGHCFESNDAVLKIMGVELNAVKVVGSKMFPSCIVTQDYFDNNFHRREFECFVENDFLLEDTILISELKTYIEIDEDEFQEKMKNNFDKFLKELKKKN